MVSNKTLGKPLIVDIKGSLETIIIDKRPNNWLSNSVYTAQLCPDIIDEVMFLCNICN